MNKKIISITTLLLLSSTLSAEPNNSESLFKSVLEKQSSLTREKLAESHEASNTNTSNPSLLQAVLEKQGVKRNIVIDSSNQINTVHYDSSSQQFYSLFSAALTKHFKNADKIK